MSSAGESRLRIASRPPARSYSAAGGPCGTSHCRHRVKVCFCFCATSVFFPPARFKKKKNNEKKNITHAVTHFTGTPRLALMENVRKKRKKKGAQWCPGPTSPERERERWSSHKTDVYCFS